MKGQIYKTAPLEIWKKAKELRAKWQGDIGTDNRVLGQGGCYWVQWSECFPALSPIEDNPVGAMIQSTDSAFARTCRLASEVRGWGREICGYQGNIWGSQFLGYQQDGSPFPLRHFVTTMHCVCDEHTKRGQQCRDFAPVPQWNRDQFMYLGPTDPERDIPMIEEKIYAAIKQLGDLERILGQKFDDEKLVKMITTTKLIESYTYKLGALMTNIPAPISAKDLYSFYTIGGLTKMDPEETVKFWQELVAEVEWRVQNEIAAVGNERYRWVEAHPPSWHFLKYYRYMEQYGAVCLGSQYTHSMGGPTIAELPDGSIGMRPLPAYPQGMPIKTREDAIRFVERPDAREPIGFKQDEYVYHDSLVKFAKLFKADGAVLALWRCGVGCAMTRKEQGLLLSQDGVRVLHYEGSQPGDRTDLDEKRFLDQLDTWMESQGLEKLED